MDAISSNNNEYDKTTIERIKAFVGNHFAIEWAHCMRFEGSHSQVPENLGAMVKWMNTYMIVLERVSRDFYKRLKDNPGSVVKVTPTFTMLGDTDIVKRISYKITVLHERKELIMGYTIDAIAPPDRAHWVPDSDSVQITTAGMGVMGFDPSISIETTVFPPSLSSLPSSASPPVASRLRSRPSSSAFR